LIQRNGLVQRKPGHLAFKMWWLKDSEWVQLVRPEVRERLCGSQMLSIPWKFPEQRTGNVFVTNI